MPLENDDSIRDLLRKTKTIAMIGASDNPMRDSHSIMQYLLNQGYNVIPVNPGSKTVLGKKCYPSLADIDVPIDIVDVFRKPEAVDAIVDEVLAAGGKLLWLQLGVVNEPAAARAEQQGLQVVMDRCIGVEHRRLVR